MKRDKHVQAKHISDDAVISAVRVARAEKFARWPYDILAEQYGCHWKVAYRAMERASERGLIDYGVSLRTAWVVDADEDQ